MHTELSPIPLGTGFEMDISEQSETPPQFTSPQSSGMTTPTLNLHDALEPGSQANLANPANAYQELHADMDGCSQPDLTNPTNMVDVNFPPLPAMPAHNERVITKPRLGRVKLTLGRKKARDSDKSKRPQPPSPIGDRTPKRHTSTAVPPMGTPVLLTVQPSPDGTQAPLPPPNNQAQPQMRQAESADETILPSLPSFTFSRSLSMPRNEGTLPDQSTTLVANSAWDDILVDSPTGSPSPNKYGHSGPNALRLSSVPLNRQDLREEIYRDVKTDNGITTNSTGLQRTAIPNGGWPKVHLGTHPLENVATSQVLAWKRVSTNKIWVRLFRSKYEANSLATVDKTRALIKGLVRIENELALGVSFPLQERAMDADRFPPPYHMLVSGLTTAQTNHLVNLEIVSTKDITVVFKSFSDTRPTFVMTIYGLTFIDSADARSAVTDLVVSSFQESEQVIKHIVECAPEYPERVASDVLNSISVKFLDVKRSKANGGDFRGWNVFLNHSFLSDDDHIKLIQLMRSCTFPSATSGFGLPLLGKNMLCTNCKSIDHDTPNCPFPDLPGWLGYKPAQIQPNPTSHNAYNNDTESLQDNHGRGRGFYRGRGSGVRGSRPYGRRAFRGHWN